MEYLPWLAVWGQDLSSRTRRTPERVDPDQSRFEQASEKPDDTDAIVGFIQNPVNTTVEHVLVPAALSILRGLSAKKAKG